MTDSTWQSDAAAALLAISRSWVARPISPRRCARLAASCHASPAPRPCPSTSSTPISACSCPRPPTTFPATCCRPSWRQPFPSTSRGSAIPFSARATWPGATTCSTTPASSTGSSGRFPTNRGPWSRSWSTTRSLAPSTWSGGKSGARSTTCSGRRCRRSGDRWRCSSGRRAVDPAGWNDRGL